MSEVIDYNVLTRAELIKIVKSLKKELIKGTIEEEMVIFRKVFKWVRRDKVKALVENAKNFPSMEVTLKHTFSTEIDGKVLVVSFSIEDED